MAERQLVQLTFHPPYIKPSNWGRVPLGFPPETPQDRELFKEIVGRLIRWCLDRQFIARHKTADGFIPIIDKNTGSFSHTLHMFNLRRLVEQAELDVFIGFIQDTDLSHYFTELQMLAIELSIAYDTVYIDRLINKIYRGYHAIPHPTADLSWSDIHRAYPFLWVFFLIQHVLHSYVEPVPPTVF